ncbi:terpene synthase family protein [Streptomyces sp. CA-181903]|uniref:terpene synthase family protein n=1 Tax=Streptomyces sp. CA-181903 TaxID=3240055 RepID=UPI003D8C0376
MGHTASPSPEPGADLTEPARPNVLAAVERALPRVRAWAGRYSVMGASDDARDTVVWSTLYGAATWPDGSAQTVADEAALALALFAYDDLMEGKFVDLSYRELGEVAEACLESGFSRTATGRPDIAPGAPREVVDAFSDVFHRLRKCPAWPSIEWYVAQRWRKGLAAMLRDSGWRLGVEKRPETLAEYLPTAVESLLTIPYAAAWMVKCGVTKLDAADLTRWHRAADEAAMALRLSNDLGTAERESLSGTVNAVEILMRGGMSLDQATTSLRDMAAASLARLGPAVDALPEHLMPPGRAMVRVARFTCGWWTERDTDALQLAELRGLLGARGDQEER